MIDKASQGADKVAFGLLNDCGVDFVFFRLNDFRGRPMQKRVFVVLACVLLVSRAALAQQQSGIAGVVRDSSGGVLPGVTVEAASPALIERVRSVVTDSEGRYNIVDLRPGTYAVTFSLAGFRTLKREGIALTVGFTATVNADLPVGSLEETITVSGASPLVDTQNIRQQRVVDKENFAMLPTATMTPAALTMLVPGMKGNTDVGGSGGTYANSGGSVSYHGKTGRKFNFDGMQIQNIQGAGNTSYMMNQALIEETSVETGGAEAESASSGITVNGIPREGSNTFRGGTRGLFSNGRMQDDNFTDELRASGLTNVNKVKHIYDASATFGGPIVRDRVWFFSAWRRWGNRNDIAGTFHNLTPGTPLYTPDLSRPAQRFEWYNSYATRVTWQASQKNRIAIFIDIQSNCDCRREEATPRAPEAQSGFLFWPTGLSQVDYTYPVTSRFLIEAGASYALSNYENPLQPGTDPNWIAIVEQSTNLNYNGHAGQFLRKLTISDRYAERLALSYITGSHTVKAGMQLQQGIRDSDTYHTQEQMWRFNRGVPNRITQFTGPFVTKERMKADLGLFAQDKWTIKQLTLAYGLRFDYLNAYVPEQHIAPTRFVPFERDFARVDGLPRWTDLNPRLGVSYDLFGDGRTALKTSLGRYVNINAVDIAGANNPILSSVNQANRSWNDANRNYTPDCDLNNFAANGECGAMDNSNFGGINPNAVRWDPDVLRGFAKRDHLWDFAVEAQHELTRGMSVNFGYNRSWYDNLRVTDNTLVTPADFDTYCITAPLHPTLPGGGGYQVCGLADLSEAKFGASQNLVTHASNFGKQTAVNNYYFAGFNLRLDSGAQVGGGVDTGREVADRCFVVDSPQELVDCRVITPFSANLQIKLNGSYPLPGDFVVSGVFQNIGGPAITANYTATAAEIRPSLGRDLSGRAANATVPLIGTNTMFEGRRSQLDLRIGKRFRVNQRMRVQANLDLYNALNGSAILTINNTYGPNWLQPLRILDARLLQISGSLEF